MKKHRGRPFVEDRESVRKRATIMILPEVQQMARELGDGNFSKGLEIAVRKLYETNAVGK